MRASLMFRRAGEKWETGMPGGYATRIRLASTKGPFGPWEHRTKLFAAASISWLAWSALLKYLPPECIAPGREKIRSPRPDVTLATLFLATGYIYPMWHSPTDARYQATRLKEMLDLPVEEIEARAHITALKKLAGR